MGKTQIILIALIGIAAIGLFNLQSNSEPHEKVMFEVWQQKMNKQYDVKQHSYRFGIWLRNLQYVKNHNKRFEQGLQTYELQMNLFADLTSEQFGARHLGLQKVGATSKCTGAQAPTSNLPSEVNWDQKGAVTPVKNQGQCGSCWAFSATGSLQGAHFKATSKLSSFSEQQLVDCSTKYGNQGCNGGLMNQSFWYVKDEGITLEASYPYRGVGGQCHYNASTDKAWIISDCTDITVNKEDALMGAINQQPISVAIQANHLSFQLYKGGVYSGNCGTNLDHGVLAVGYGTQSGKKFYRVKNSWGLGWGSKGYILIERTGDGKGKCGIQQAASFPIA